MYPTTRIKKNTTICTRPGDPREFHTSGLFPDFDPVYLGRTGLTEFWHGLREPWEELRSTSSASIRR